jgi:uncharacterized lipoprotein YddW (UPF0748 family)
MKKIRVIVLFILLTFIFSTFVGQDVYGNGELVPLIRGTQTIRHYNSTNNVMIPEFYIEKSNEFRGVWVATVFNLNFPQHTSEAQYKAAFNSLIEQVKAKNMNVILFQVRPLNDAFYESELAPFSRYLTGVEGSSPGWDALEYMIETAHANGIEFHAWMNPYRVANSSASKQAYLNTLHPSNFARQNPDLVVAGKLSNGLNPYILNPGEPLVKQYIRDVVVELIENYNVDGIHFDDYFYPYSGIDTDTATYNTYAKSGQSIADWRRENVNDVIRGVKEDIDLFNLENNRDIRFGVSPFGIWKSGGTDGSNTSTAALQSFVTQFADSKKWVEEGWVHYIAPQVYWPFSHTLAPYADVVDWWASITRGTGVDLVIGHSTYHASDNNWLTDEITTQLRYNQKHPEIKGSIFYSRAYLEHAHTTHVVQNAWQNKPLSVWDTSNVTPPSIILEGSKDGLLYRSNVTVSFDSEYDVYYQVDLGNWTLYESPFVLSEQKEHVVYYKSVNSEGEESLVQSINIKIEKVNSDVPTIEITGDKIGNDYVTGAIVNLSSSENEIWYAINFGSIGAWQPYTGPITLEAIGNHFIRTKTINAEGIESAEQTQLVRIVENCFTPPTIEVQGVGNHPYYQQGLITIQGVTSRSYRINGGTWQTYDEPFELDIENTYLIEARNEDGCKIVVSLTIHIDQSPPLDPELIITGELEGRNYIEPTLVTLIKDDADDIIMYRLHNGRTWSAWEVYVNPIELNQSANYTLEYYAKDLANNQSELQEVSIRVNIPPSEENIYVIRDNKVVNYYNTNNPVILPSPYVEKTNEVRAVWVATVNNIDITTHSSKAQYQSQIIVMLDRIKANNFNTVFFQVRPMNDAFYASDYAPFSRYLTGVEGQDPGWDVLEFIITEAHKRGLELHAWLNPYRVSNSTLPKDTQLSMLHQDNFAKQNPHLVIADKNGRLILNPGEPQVRAYVLNIVQELMIKYDVDGIHFDDYFYSYSGMNDDQDAQTYIRTRQSGQTLEDWRRSNVDTLVRNIYNAVESYNENFDKNVKFGISPFGIWRSGGEHGSNTSPVTLQSYSDQYADTRKWVMEGWLHYIIPQLYWQFDHQLAPFADLVDWWATLCEAHGVDLIIGQGFYRYADNSWTDENELLEQLRYMQKYDVIIGSSFFSYKTLISPNTLVTQALSRLNTVYWSAFPAFPWATDVVPPTPDPTCEPGQSLIDGECVDDVVIPVCEDGYRLVDGECIKIVEEPARRGCFGIFTNVSNPSFTKVSLSLLPLLLIFVVIWFKRPS